MLKFYAKLKKIIYHIASRDVTVFSQCIKLRQLNPRSAIYVMRITYWYLFLDKNVILHSYTRLHWNLPLSIETRFQFFECRSWNTGQSRQSRHTSEYSPEETPEKNHIQASFSKISLSYWQMQIKQMQLKLKGTDGVKIIFLIRFLIKLLIKS